MQKKLEIFSKRLRAARESKKLSQNELAEKAGFQPSAISHFETGNRSPSFANLKRLADALDITVDYLLGRAEEPQNPGLVAEQLFRHLEQMSPDDQETITKMAKMLANKNKKSGEPNAS